MKTQVRVWLCETRFQSLGKTGTKKPRRQRFFYWTMALMGDPAINQKSGSNNAPSENTPF
jgi:hypothetical protein